MVLPKSTVRVLQDVTGEPRPDAALLLVLRDAIAYRLAQAKTALQDFESRYGMSFEEYRRHWETEDREEDYRWEAERDYLEWEALVTRARRLEDAYAWLA